MTVSIRSQKYRDPMAKKRHRRVWLKGMLWGVAIIAVGFFGVVEIHRIAPTVAKHFQKAAIAPVVRESIGTWCRGDSCEFFDRSGTRWGQALQSSGPLLLLVTDNRTEDARDPEMFSGMLAAVDGLSQFGLAAKKVTLPDAEPGGITIATTKGYDLYIDAQGNVPDQLAVLGVFLADRANPPAGGPVFTPLYIDLRTPGRVYYK